MSPSTRVVLVRPRSPGNVGSVARALKNFGLADLVLVDPRLHRAGDTGSEEPYFERESRRMAWGASDLLERARTCATLAEAVAGCGLVLATAPRAYSGVPGLTPEEGAERLSQDAGHPSALLFGSESSGLTLDEISACSGVVVIPTDPAYRDLNLAQSAVLMAYLIFRASAHGRPPGRHEPAPHEEVDSVALAWLDLARDAGFLKHAGAPVGRELRAILHRMGLSRRETGLLKSLGRRLRARLRAPE